MFIIYVCVRVACKRVVCVWLVLFVWGDAWSLVSVDKYLSVEDLDGRTGHEYVAI